MSTARNPLNCPLLARRWAACVDFGSVVSAWTPAMFEESAAARREGRQPDMANVRAIESKREASQ